MENSENTDKISFDEIPDIEALQRKIILETSAEEMGDSFTAESADAILARYNLSLTEDEPEETDDTYKKIIFYVDKDNLEFVESLTNSEKTEMINELIFDYKNERIKEKRIKSSKKHLTHLIIALITILLTAPIMMKFFNKFIVLTTENYIKAEENYVHLYRSKGKLKKKNFKALKKLEALRKAEQEQAEQDAKDKKK